MNFGCIAYAFVNPQKRTKLDEKSEKCIFIGYCTQSKGYRLYSPESGKIMVSRNVMFDENSNWKWNEEKQGVEIIAAELDNVEDEVLQQPSNSISSDLNNSSSDADLPPDSPDRSRNLDPNTPTMRVYSRRHIVPNTPIRKMKSVQELYETTQVLFIVDAATDEEAAEQARTVKLKRKSSEEQNRCILTKPLVRSKFKLFRSAFGVTNFASRGSVEY